MPYFTFVTVWHSDCSLTFETFKLQNNVVPVFVCFRWLFTLSSLLLAEGSAGPPASINETRVRTKEKSEEEELKWRRVKTLLGSACQFKPWPGSETFLLLLLLLQSPGRTRAAPPHPPAWVLLWQCERWFAFLMGESNLMPASKASSLVVGNGCGTLTLSSVSPNHPFCLTHWVA